MENYNDQHTPLFRDAVLGLPTDQNNPQTENHDVEFSTKVGKAAKLPQFLATIICCLAPITFGTVLGYSSPTIEQLTELKILDEEKSSWHASIVTLGAVVGGLLGGVFIDTFGRKGTLLACGLPYSIGWLMIMSVGLVKSFGLLISGRFLTGATMGVICTAAPTYIAEIATPELRGTLGNQFQLAVTLGLVLAFGLGIVLTWQWLAVACSAIAACMSIAILFIPESPIYLTSKGYKNEALASLRWLRGTNYDYHEEFYDIAVRQDETSEVTVTFKDIVTKKHLYKPILITLGLLLFQQLSGVNTFLFYTESIFKSAGSTNAGLSGLIIAAVQVGATLFSVFIMDIAGRRILLLISALFTMISCVTLGLFYFLNEVKGMDNINWLPLASLIVFITAFSIGWGPIPWTMMAELVPPSAKGFASSLAVVTSFTASFAETKEFPAMEVAFTKYGVIWLFAGINALGLVFTALCVPETKGKSLAEIQQQFHR